MIRKIPRQIASSANVPDRKQASDLSRVLRQLADNARGEKLQGLRQNGFQEIVHALEIVVFRTVFRRNQVELAVRVEQGHRQIVIDVSVHTRQSKLNTINAGGKARLEERCPRTGYIGRVLQPGGDCPKV